MSFRYQLADGGKRISMPKMAITLLTVSAGNGKV